MNKDQAIKRLNKLNRANFFNFWLLIGTCILLYKLDLTVVAVLFFLVYLFGQNYDEENMLKDRIYGKGWDK